MMGNSPTKLPRMGQGQITCNCSQVFPTLDILERHMMSAHPENTNLVGNHFLYILIKAHLHSLKRLTRFLNRILKNVLTYIYVS